MFRCIFMYVLQCQAVESNFPCYIKKFVIFYIKVSLLITHKLILLQISSHTRCLMKTKIYLWVDGLNTYCLPIYYTIIHMYEYVYLWTFVFHEGGVKKFCIIYILLLYYCRASFFPIKFGFLCFRMKKKKINNGNSF